MGAFGCLWVPETKIFDFILYMGATITQIKFKGVTKMLRDKLILQMVRYEKIIRQKSLTKGRLNNRGMRYLKVFRNVSNYRNKEIMKQIRYAKSLE